MLLSYLFLESIVWRQVPVENLYSRSQYERINRLNFRVRVRASSLKNWGVKYPLEDYGIYYLRIGPRVPRLEGYSLRCTLHSGTWLRKTAHLRKRSERTIWPYRNWVY